MRQTVYSACAAFLALLALSQAAVADRVSVEGDTLTFDTEIPVDDRLWDIRSSDVQLVRDALRENPDVKVLALNSTGGGHYAAMELSALIVDYELDTHVVQTCESSCVTVFLGGKERSMARGGRIGFHQLSWSASAVEEYYTDNRSDFDWDTPFDFAEWMYQDTQTETYNRLAYMVSRGVQADFAIQTIRKPDTSMWFPPRVVLMAAGVLTR